MADFSDRELPDTIVLFDVDGTLTVPRKVRGRAGERGHAPHRTAGRRHLVSLTRSPNLAMVRVGGAWGGCR